MTPEQVGEWGCSHAGAFFLTETRKCRHTLPRMKETLARYASKLCFQTLACEFASASEVNWDSRATAPLVSMSVEEALGFVLLHPS